MIGQEQLINKLTSYSVDSLPQSMLLIGEQGCGKHTLISLLAKNLNLDIIELSSETTADDLNEYKLCPFTRLYIIDISSINEKKQNQFLKIIEEPSDRMHFVIIAESELFVLNTIANRCIKFYFNDYTDEQLKSFKYIANPIAYKICRTPGQLEVINDSQIDSIIQLCNNVLNKMSVAKYSNVISISTKLNYGEQYDKFDIVLFFNTMLYVSFADFIDTKNISSFNLYNITKKYRNRLGNKSLNKESLVISYLNEIFNEFKNV